VRLGDRRFSIPDRSGHLFRHTYVAEERRSRTGHRGWACRVRHRGDARRAVAEPGGDLPRA